MIEETLTRQIKVFCPQHQSVFETADTPSIVCEIREHALSNNFPNAEFREYCRDCQTFFHSDVSKTYNPLSEKPEVKKKNGRKSQQEN